MAYETYESLRGGVSFFVYLERQAGPRLLCGSDRIRFLPRWAALWYVDAL